MSTVLFKNKKKFLKIYYTKDTDVNNKFKKSKQKVYTYSVDVPFYIRHQNKICQ